MPLRKIRYFRACNGDIQVLDRLIGSFSVGVLATILATMLAALPATTAGT